MRPRFLSVVDPAKKKTLSSSLRFSLSFFLSYRHAIPLPRADLDHASVGVQDRVVEGRGLVDDRDMLLVVSAFNAVAAARRRKRQRGRLRRGLLLGDRGLFQGLVSRGGRWRVRLAQGGHGQRREGDDDDSGGESKPSAAASQHRRYRSPLVFLVLAATSPEKLRLEPSIN